MEDAVLISHHKGVRTHGGERRWVRGFFLEGVQDRRRLALKRQQVLFSCCFRGDAGQEKARVDRQGLAQMWNK